MKKLITIMILALLLVGWNKKMKAGPGDSCASAMLYHIPLAPEVIPDYGFTTNEVWYYFTANSNEIDADFTDMGLDTANMLGKVTIYGNACGSLSVLTSDTISGLSYSVLHVTSTSLTIGHNYFIKFKKRVSSSANLKMLINIDFPLTADPCDETACSSSVNCDMVCNGDFENNDVIPATYLGGIIQNLVCPWITATADGSPDFFHDEGVAFDTNPANWPLNSGTPVNCYGEQYAYSGNHYTGFFAYVYSACNTSHCGTDTTGSPRNYHEYITERTNCKLIEGVTYNISFKVSLSDYSDYATNHIGMWLTQTAPNYTTTDYETNSCILIHNRGQIQELPDIKQAGYANRITYPSGSYVAGYITDGNNDQTTWATISGDFTPSATDYYYMVIGDFGNTGTLTTNVSPSGDTPGHDLYHTYTDDIPSHTNHLLTPGSCEYTSWSYYYLDEVKVNPDMVLAKPVITPDHDVPFPCLMKTGVDYNYSFSPYIVDASYTLTVTTATGTFTTTPTLSGNTFIINWSTLPTDVTTITIGVSVCGCKAAGIYEIMPCCQHAGELDHGAIVNLGTEGNTMQYGTSYHLDHASQIMASVGHTIPTGFATGSPVLVNGMTFSINGTFYVDIDMDLLECDVWMGTEAKIIVQSRSGNIKLDVDDSHLHSCCCRMWNGIEVYGDNGGSNAASIGADYSIIEDADSAIVSNDAAKYSIDKTVFNKNYYGLIVNGNGVTSSYNSLSDYSVTKSVFTCRDIYPSYLTFVPGVIGTAVGSFIGSEYNPSQYPGFPTGGTDYILIYPNTGDCIFSSLLTPLDKKRSFTGIEVREVTDASPIILTDPNDAGNKNTFDYLDYGIRVLHSNASVYNNIFINIYNIADPTLYDCAGVFAWDWVKEGNPGYNLIAGDDPTGTSTSSAPNWFYGCTNGIYSKEYNNILNYNDMNTIKNDGMLVEKGYFLTTEINQNDMLGMNYGVVCQGRNEGNMLIENNRIHVAAQVDPHLSSAIWSFGIGVFYNYYHSTIMSIYDNKIYLEDVRDGTHGTAPAMGIYAQGNTDIYNIAYNDIHFTDPAVYSSITSSKGIDLEGNDGGNISYNTVWDDGPYYGASHTQHSVPDDLYGIMVALSTNSQVFNNTTYYMGSGIAAVGGCTSSQFGCNIMDNGNDGFMFYGAELPDQLYSNVGNGNCWEAVACGATTSGYKDVDGSVAGSNFKWNYDTPVPNYLFALNGTGSGQIDFTNVTGDGCSGDHGSGRSVGPSAEDKREMMLGKIVRGENVFDTLSQQYLYRDTAFAYHILSRFDSLMYLNTQDDNLYQAFYNFNVNRNAGKFETVQLMIDTASTNLAQANSINNAISANNT